MQPKTSDNSRTTYIFFNFLRFIAFTTSWLSVIYTAVYTYVNATLQMLNLDYEDIHAVVPRYIWAFACNFSLFLYSSKKDTFFKFW